MENICCNPDEEDEREGVCPNSGTKGQPVTWRTVAALVRGPLPPRQEFWLCLDPGCEIVYFGSVGTRIPVRGLHIEPGYKSPGDGLLCYCFGYRRDRLQQEILATGGTEIPDVIAARTKEGSCACQVRNPTGRCCLPEVRRFVAAIAALSVVEE